MRSSQEIFYGFREGRFATNLMNLGLFSPPLMIALKIVSSDLASISS